MPRVLLSYRREDSAPYAGRLYDHLSERFGRDNVFMDVATIRPGQDFSTAIEQSVTACDALVAVIGRGWLSSSDDKGRRLDRADDFVRMEIAVALSRRITVIPALVGGAAMPRSEQLPDDLSGLSRRQAIEISDTRFHQDVDRLIEALAPPAGVPIVTVDADSRKSPPPSRRWIFAVTVLLVAGLALGYWLLSGRSASPPAASSRPVTVTALPAEGSGTIDKPRPIDFAATYSLVLDKDEEAYLKLPSPAREVTLVLDSKRVDGKTNNLISTLSLLDQNGAVINARALHMNEIDTGFRQVGTFSFRQPAALTIKLVNSIDPARYWLTVLTSPGAPLTPFYGDQVPAPLTLGQAVSGELDQNEDRYYAVPLKPGDYSAILDFARPGKKDNFIGYLAVLDADGGNQRRVIAVNEIEVSHRAVGVLAMKGDGVAIVRVKNQHVGVKYGLRIVRKE
jgi:hypothetical protein